MAEGKPRKRSTAGEESQGTETVDAATGEVIDEDTGAQESYDEDSQGGGFDAIQETYDEESQAVALDESQVRPKRGKDD